MKQLTMKCMIATAVLTLVAGSATAQSMKAEIPFSFQAGKAMLHAGTYQVTQDRSTGRHYFQFQNVDTGKSIVLVQQMQLNVPRAWKADGQARLGFRCAGSRCALESLWTGTDSPAHGFAAPKRDRGEVAQIKEILLTAAKAD